MSYSDAIRRNLSLFSIFLAASLSISTGTCAASDRVALVIGNGAYRNATSLPNPPNDARAIAKALVDVGFETIFGEDLERAEMERRIRDFLRKSGSAKVALLFYAGHGMQVDGRNYLLPVDTKLETSSDLAYETIELDKIIDNLNDPSRTNIIILDACRDNPLARSFASRSGATRSGGTVTGFAAYSAVGTGTLIAYATAPGQVALDGQGVNSPFTQGLLQHLRTPGLEVRQMLTRVRADVAAATRNKQIPWDNSSLLGEIYLAGQPAFEPARFPNEPAAPPPSVAPPPSIAPLPGRRYSYIVGLDPAGDNFLALRSEPSLQRGVRLMKMGPDTVFDVISTQGDWRQIKLRTGESGWAYARYIACCKTRN